MSEVFIRKAHCWSHLDPLAGPKMARCIGQRLHRRLALARMNGDAWVMLTLTYDREPYEPDDPDAPEHLYDEAARLQHVNKFMKRLGDALGTKFTGKWIAKVEFQKGGWLHYHLILIGPSFIPHNTLLETWGHGACYVSAGTGRHAYYVSKAARYATKAEEGYPEWLYERTPKAVKLYRTSPGFWTPLIEYEQAKDAERRATLDDDDEATDTPTWRKRRQTIAERDADIDAAYGAETTIRQRIEDAQKCVRVRVPGEGEFIVECDEFLLRKTLDALCGEQERDWYGWRVYKGNALDVRHAARMANAQLKRWAADRIAEQPAAASPDDASSFTCNRHKNSTDQPSILDLAWGEPDLFEGVAA